MASKEIVIHIGTHKTGTTSLQQFLLKNVSRLKKAGWTYPLGTFISHSHYGQHTLAWSISKDDSLALWEKLLADAKKRRYKKVFVSSEEFEFFNPRHIKQLAGCLKDWKVTILVYLREQLDYLLAEYNQLIKSDAFKWSWEEFYTKMHNSRRGDFLFLLNKWAREFKKSNMKIKVFGKALLKDGDIRHDILDLLQIKSDAGGFAFPEKRLNQSIPNSLIPFMQAYNAVPDDKKILSRGRLIDVINKNKAMFSNSVASYLPREEALLIQRDYFFVNRHVKDTYMPKQKQTPLFSCGESLKKHYQNPESALVESQKLMVLIQDMLR